LKEKDMKKENVFIVLSHKHSLKKGSFNEWEVAETVEFVNKLKNRHYQTSSAIGDYINRRMVTGDKVGMGIYEGFESYIQNKYSRQMEQLDAAYKDAVIKPTVEEYDLIVDENGNGRTLTVFDEVKE
jgi:hypothetical protein